MMPAHAAEPRIEELRPALPEEWDRAWEASSCATHFHSREWMAAWEVYLPWALRDATRFVRFSDGRSAVIPLAMKRTHRGLTRTVLASAAGTYGGWISADPLGSAHAILLEGILRAYPNLVWRINPFDPTSTPNVSGSIDDTTQVVRLDAPVEELVRRWSKGHRAAVRQAERVGVIVRPASSPADWGAYFEIYEASSRRWGKRGVDYGRPLFGALAESGTGNRTLLLAEVDGRVVAGTLLLFSPHHAVYWHGAALAESFPLRPVHLLIREGMRLAVERGCDWFDFNPSAGLQGVRAFKRGFGATDLAAPTVIRRRGLARVITALANVGARAGR